MVGVSVANSFHSFFISCCDFLYSLSVLHPSETTAASKHRLCLRAPSEAEDGGSSFAGLSKNSGC